MLNEPLVAIRSSEGWPLCAFFPSVLRRNGHMLAIAAELPELGGLTSSASTAQAAAQPVLRGTPRADAEALGVDGVGRPAQAASWPGMGRHA